MASHSLAVVQPGRGIIKPDEYHYGPPLHIQQLATEIVDYELDKSKPLRKKYRPNVNINILEHMTLWGFVLSGPYMAATHLP